MSADPAPRPPLQERIATAILSGAAEALAADPEASMSAIAAASGVARATLYRYFPSRDALLAELAAIAVHRAETALAAARVDEVAPVEGVRRAVRALVEVGDPFIAVARNRSSLSPDAFEHRLATPLRRLFDRGQDEGAIRRDIPSAWLTESLVGLVVSGLGTQPALGREDTIALISGLFLHGASTPP